MDCLRSDGHGHTRILHMIKPQCEAEEKLLSDVRLFKNALLREGAPASSDTLAARLSEAGYACAVRAAAGGGARGGRGGPKACCFKNLRNVFLLVSVMGDDGSDLDLIVEASFKEHFLIPHPSAAYEDLLSLLPEEFVGTRARLVPLVEALCEEMAASFESRGLALPPWRRAKAVASKWLPERGADACSGAGADAGAPGCCGGASPPAGASSNGSGGSGGGLSFEFSRLDDGELLRNALTRRNSGKGLLSGKLLGCCPGASPPVALGGGGGTQQGRAGFRCTIPGSVVEKAAAAAGRLISPTASQDGAAQGAATEGAGAGGARVRGLLSRHPPLFLGQPATWRVRVGCVAQQAAPPPPLPGALWWPKR